MDAPDDVTRWEDGEDFQVLPSPPRNRRKFDGRQVLIDQAHLASVARGCSGWLRVGLLGWARAYANGHAPYPQGRLAEEAGITPRHLSREIKKAVDAGLLLDGSCAQCLIVPTPVESRWVVPDGFCCVHDRC